MSTKADEERGLVHNILVVANLLSAVKISHLSVPELTQSKSPVTLDCEFTSRAWDDNVTVSWLFNGDRSPVYRWKPNTEPEVNGVLDGRLDLRYTATTDPRTSRRALRISEPTPELSGEYTCVVTSQERNEDRQTASMLVYNPEQEFTLSAVESEPGVTNITCVARGAFPQPHLVLEYNHALMSVQSLRVWRSSGPLFDAACSAQHPAPRHPTPPRSAIRHPRRARVACKLHIPQAGYSAIRKLVIHDNLLNVAALKLSETSLLVSAVMFAIHSVVN